MNKNLTILLKAPVDPASFESLIAHSWGVASDEDKIRIEKLYPKLLGDTDPHWRDWSEMRSSPEGYYWIDDKVVECVPRSGFTGERYYRTGNEESYSPEEGQRFYGPLERPE